MILCELRDSVAVVRMEHGKVNAIDLELFTALSAEFNRLANEPISAVVLTGSGKAFSAGVDLFRVLNSGPDYLEKFLPAFSDGLKTLFLFPKPVVAAVNGHAIAGGCVFTCACDYRIMAAGSGFIGVPELLVGVPFPALALEVVRFGSASQFLQEIVYTGRTYSPEQALERGLLDEVVPPEKLIDRAVSMAAEIGSIPHDAFRLTKLNLRQPVVDRAAASPREPDVVRTWKAKETHDFIRQYLQKTIGKK